MRGNVKIADFEVGKNPTFTIAFTNSGRRPARVDLMAIREGYYASFPTNPDREYIADTTPSTNVVVPGQPVIASSTTDTPLSQQNLDDAFRQFFIYFVFAKVEYRDLRTNESHWTHISKVYA